MLRRDFLATSSGAAILAAATTAGGCSKKRSLDKLRVAAQPRFFNVGFHTAVEYGYFKEAGLDLEVHGDTRTEGLVPLLAGGELDIGLSSVNSSFFSAVARGARIRVVAGRGMQTQGCGFAATLYGRKKSFPDGMVDFKELKGKNIAGHSKGSLQEFILHEILAKGGLSFSEVNVVRMHRQEAFAAVSSGRMDVMLDYDSDKSLTDVSQTVVKGPDLGTLFPNLQVSNIQFGSKLLDAPVDLGARFLAAYLKGVRAFLGGANPKWIDWYANNFKLDANAIKTGCRNFLTPHAAVEMDTLKRFLEWAIGMGYCPQGFQAERTVDLRFLEEAWRQVGRTS